MEWQALLVLITSLAGVGALIAALINTGKSFGLIKDGQAPTYNVVLNLIALVVLVVAKLVKPELDIQGVDAQVAQFGNVMVVVVGYVIQIGGAKLVHNLIKGTPLIGKSLSS